MEEGPAESWKLRADIPFFSNQQRVCDDDEHQRILSIYSSL
jgi:hypothetical protein